MKRHLKNGLITLAILITLVTAILFMRQSQFRDVFQFTCRMVAAKFYEHSEKLDQWAEDCEKESLTVSFFWGRDKLIRIIQRQLDQLGISHLMIYNPDEEKYLWKGQALDTGIRVRLIDGQFVVSEVLLNSGAAKVDVKPGDIVRTLDGKPVITLTTVQSGKGLFEFERGKKTYQAFIEPTELQVDSSPQIVDVGKGVGLLRISSFRSEYFDAENWKKQIEELKKFNRIVVDLRENSGGNFVAMLRALSPFMCESQIVGELQMPRRKAEILKAIDDNTDDFYQIKVVEQYRAVGLQTFAGYGCLKQPVVVLTDAGTASVSEIFASAIHMRPKSQVWGASTRGDVVLAIWYNIPFFAKGYSLSIPEAQVVTYKGEMLEGKGVWPDRDLYYVMEDAVKGEDTWLLKAYLHK